MTWPEVPFGELATLMANGLSPSSKGTYEADVLTLSAVTRGRFDAAFAKTALLDKEPGPEQVVRGSTFLVCRGNGNVGLVGAGVFGEEVGCQLVFPDTIIGCQVDLTRVHRPFLQAAWRSPAVRSQIEAGARTTNGTFKINQKVLSAVTVPLPPLPEQKRIAAILDKADEIRRKRQETIRLTEELLRSTFLEMFGDPVTNPKGWEVRRLEDLADIGSGATKGRKFGDTPTVEVPYMRVANVQDGFIDLSDVKTIEVLAGDVERFALKSGDVLLTEGGDPDKLGRGAVWQDEITPCIHQNHIFRVRSTSPSLDPVYLSALIGSPYGKDYFLRAAKQTTGIATINKTQLRAFPVLLPPRDLQLKYKHVTARVRALRGRSRLRFQAEERLGVALADLAFRGRV